MAARPNRTTIVVRPDIRDGLKHIARKDQSYNELLADLIQLHTDHFGTVLKSCDNPGPESHPKPGLVQASEVHIK
jgi:hypothetical protein